MTIVDDHEKDPDGDDDDVHDDREPSLSSTQHDCGESSERGNERESRARVPAAVLNHDRGCNAPPLAVAQNGLAIPIERVVDSGKSVLDSRPSPEVSIAVTLVRRR